MVTGRITTGQLRGPYRLCYVRTQLSRILDIVNPTLATYEDYALGAKGNNMFHIGELGGVLKTLLWERGIDILPIGPTAMKSAIALHGRAEKEQIIAALKVHYGLTVSQHDEADAAALLLLGEMQCGIRNAPAIVRKSGRLDTVQQCAVIKGKPPLR